MYSSLLAFAPNKSTVRLIFETQIPSWILLEPKTESVWAQYLQTLEDHGAVVNSVAFSYDSKLIASASNDETGTNLARGHEPMCADSQVP